jgi:hypothetical protein
MLRTTNHSGINENPSVHLPFIDGVEIITYKNDSFVTPNHLNVYDNL